ncbi:MAG: calcium-binding protein, partial [Alphaproteobacteria bacterium]|nr:calcium-binding protein [Alphaproteobacteria bacterium]
MANILKIFSNSLVQGTDDDDFITVLAGNATIEGKLGNDKIITLIGNNTIYGDLSAVTVSAVGGINTPVTGGNITATYGNDCVYAGLGNDIVVGDVGDILLRAKAGSTTVALFSGNADALLENVFLTMGMDTLYGGLGNDSLYGDVRTMTLESMAGTANAGSNAGNQSANARIQLVTFTGGVDHIYGGDGNDNLYGDIGTMTLIVRSGNSLGTSDAANAFIRPISFDDLNTFTMGNDFLYGDNGNDILSGDIGNLTLKAGDLNGILVNRGGNNVVLSDATQIQAGDIFIPDGSGTGIGNAQARGQIIGNTFNMGADELHGGNGNDTLYGDISNQLIFAQGGQTLSTGASTTAFIQLIDINPDLQPDLFNMGIDQLYGDNGNDNLIGDIGTLTIKGVGGYANSGTATSGISNAQITANFNMGGNYLDGGQGNDSLWGNVTNLQIIGVSGAISGTGLEVGADVGSKISMVTTDTLLGGDGNDVLYGDIGDFTYNMAVATNSTTANPTFLFAGSQSEFAVSLTLGADNLSGGNGVDVLYGDMGTLSLSLSCGTNSGSSTHQFSAESDLRDATFIMGADTLDGGASNDTLYGDIGSFSAILTPGSGVGTTPLINNTLIQFGNDTLIGGSGNDTLIGDIANPSQLSSFMNATLLSADSDGNAPIPNQIIFGNDTFVFTLCGNNGNDIIKDMNVGATSTATTTVTN